MKTNSHIKIEQMGQSVQGITLLGDHKKPEFEEFRIVFPGGHASVVRCTDGSYWVHAFVDHAKHPGLCPGEYEPASMAEARLDLLDKHSADADLGDFSNPNLYHLAVRIARDR
jgi:hypothetical protein